MPGDTDQVFPEGDKSSDEQIWSDLFAWLLPPIKGWVYQARIETWRGQQSEIAEEIAQEALTRAFAYMQHARAKKCPPVANLKAFCHTIARRLFLDHLKKDWRTVPLSPDESSSAIYALNNEQHEPEDTAMDHIILEETIVLAAEIIASLPHKQKKALLTDIAKNTEFTRSPSLLEQTFAKLGIQLRDYTYERSDDLKERNRQAALLWSAYQRLRKQSDSSGSQEQPSGPKVDANMEKIQERREGDTETPAEPLAYVTRLQEPYQRAVHLHYVEGYSYPQIAAKLALPLGTVKAQVSRGYKLLCEIQEHNTTKKELAAAQKRADILEGINTVPAPYRQIISLHYLEGKSYSEIATHLKIPLNTVKSYAHRGMKIMSQ